MADPFTPKFVDLVRNFTTTVGTGNLVLGDAAPGFESFAAALQPGDSFYYSVAGIDTPGETEVGRGTLLADGSIARQPTVGSATNFTSGRKTVALVAAAEWFERLEASGQSGAATRAALAAQATTAPAYLREPGREGLFLFDASNLSAQVSIDTAQGLLVAPASDPSGAAGSWVRMFEGAVDPRWFGIIEGDSSANGTGNSAAMTALLAAVAARGAHRIAFGYGTYWFGSTIELSAGNLVLEGPSAGSGGANGNAILKFPAGVTGIRVHGQQTSGANIKDVATHDNASGAIIRHLTLRGAFAASEAEAHGIQLRTDASVEHVVVSRFEGDGIYIGASAGAETQANPPYGNANVCLLNRVAVRRCRNGLKIDGSNANACTVTNFDAAECRQWGIWDSSFLGNSFFGGHVAGNGSTSSNDGVVIGASLVSHNANRYFAILGQEAAASTTPPSGDATDNSAWAYYAPGVSAPGVPEWFSGIVVRAGGAICDDELSSCSIYSGVYAEFNQPKAQIVQQSLVMGGILAQWLYQNPAAGMGTAVLASAANGVIAASPALQSKSGKVTATLGAGAGNSSNVILDARSETIAPGGHQIMFHAASNALLLTYDKSTAASNFALRVSGVATADQFGTGSAQPHVVYMPRLAVGDDANIIANARRLLIDIGPLRLGAAARASLCSPATAPPTVSAGNAP